MKLTKNQLQALVHAMVDGSVTYGPGTKMGSRGRPTIASLVKRKLLKPYQHNTRECHLTPAGRAALDEALTPPAGVA